MSENDIVRIVRTSTGEQEKTVNWEKLWGERYERFVTNPRGHEKPDLLLFSVPNSVVRENDDWPEGKLTAGTIIDARLSTGLAVLATTAEKNNIKTGVCYTHATYARNENNENCGGPNPKEAAMIALSSGADSIGLSLLWSLDLDYVKKMTSHMREVSKTTGREMPKIIVGGPQASLDAAKTASTLDIPLENVVVQRGESKLVELISDVKTNDIDKPNLFDARFLMPPGSNGFNPVVMNLISTGGLSCIGTDPCSFCNAYHLGKRNNIPETVATEQIDLLKQAGFFNIMAADNFINTAKSEERERFLRILKHAQDQNVFIGSFLTRPDLLAKTPNETLSKVRQYGTRSVHVGIESGNIETLVAMRRVQGKTSANRYLKDTITACEKVARVGLHCTLGAILAYPTEATIEKSIENDRQTLAHMKKLIDTVEPGGFPPSVEVQISPVWILSGSALYAEMVKRGATPEQLDAYTVKLKVEWENLVDKIIGGGDDVRRLHKVLSDAKEEDIETILDFLTQKRREMDSMLDKKYLKKGEN